MKRTVVFLALILVSLLWGDTVINGSRSILGTWNAGGAAATIPAKVGTTLPGTCGVGEQFFKSDATAGQNIYLCTATNTWTQVTGGGGGGDQICTPGDLRYICWADDMMTGTSTSGQLGLMGWQSFNAGGGSVAQLAGGTWPNVGILRLTTGATSGNMIAISLNGNGPLDNWYANAVRNNEVKVVFRLNSHSDSNFRIIVGGVNTGNGTVQNGFGIGKVGSNFALLFGAAGESGTTADFGVALDSTWHTVRFYTDPNVNQRVYVTLDDTTTRTVCPSGCDLTASTPFSFADYNIAATVTTNTSSTRTLDIDYVSVKATVGTDPDKRN